MAATPTNDFSLKNLEDIEAKVIKAVQSAGELFILLCLSKHFKACHNIFNKVFFI